MDASGAQLEARQRPIDPALRIAAVHLGVADVRRSAAFYEHVLGLATIASDEQGATLGADGEQPMLVLSRVQQAAPAPPHSTGLFHVAWLHSSRAELAATVERVVRADWSIHGASDHGVSEALYLSDPDGLGIEIYADRPREQWRRPPDGRGVEIVTLPLDVDDLLAQSPLEPVPEIGGRTVVGHIHLKVSDVERASGFYRDVLGFSEQASMPSASFLAAGGYHHHIGLNSWQSHGAGPPSEHAPGLREVVFELSGAGELEQLQQRVAAAEEPLDSHPGKLRLRDPDGTRLAFVASG